MAGSAPAAVSGSAVTLWTDVLGLRRSLDRLDRLIEQEPGFNLMRDGLRIAYWFRRGDYAEVTVCGEESMRRHPPLTRLGWSISHAMVALAYVELGRAERALEICEAAFAHVREADREYFVMYSALEAAYAAALALSGELDRADEIFRVRSARMAAAQEPVCIALFYEYRIKVARMRGDPTGLQQAIDELNAAALVSRNPGIVALAHRLCHVRNSQAGALDPRSDARTKAPNTVTAYLCRAEDSADRAQRALAVLGHYAGTGEGYLYLEHETLQLSAALHDDSPPDTILPKLLQIAAANDAQGCTELGEDYYAYRIEGGFAVLRAANTHSSPLPESLLSEVGACLRCGTAQTRSV